MTTASISSSSTPINDIMTYCHDYLNVNNFNDYCPNGLQVEGTLTIKKIVSGVTASQALIDAAINAQADILLVHHGFFWKGEKPSLVGMKYRRIKALINHDINLLTYHLPLDAHPIVGNNHLFARALNIGLDNSFGHHDLGLSGMIEEISGDALKNTLHRLLTREPLHIMADRPIRRIGLCTGAAHGFIEEAIEHGVDAFISGEISENTVHLARENGIHYFAAGHHATERFGVRALGQHLAKQFSLEHLFIDIDNPV